MPPTVASREDFERLETKIDKVFTLLNGNGTPGVFTRLVVLENWKAQREEEIKTERAEEKEEAKTAQERVWEFAKPFVVNAINSLVLIVALLVALHFPPVAALFGLKVSP